MVVPVPLSVDPGLQLIIEIKLVRVKRRRCPRCQRVRVLFRLSAWSRNSPVGDGPLLCGECGDIRPDGGG